MTVHKTDGELFGPGEVQENPVVIALDAGQSVRRDVAELFGFQGEATVVGWLEIESSLQAVNGFLAYRVPTTGASAAVAAAGHGATSAIFSHLATTGGFFTGVAGVNPSSYPINLRIVALSISGEVLGTYDRVLAPGERIAELISNIIPAAAGQGGGFILIRTNYPAFFVSLFGTFNGKTFANIPPQIAPAEFAPDAELPQALVTPAVSVVLPGMDLQLTVQGIEGDVEWKVNGVLGGSAETGTVTQAGLYTAPDVQPSQLPITISAEGDGLAASAAVDVLDAQTQIQGLGSVRSLAFLERRQSLYIAEAIGQDPAARVLGVEEGVSSRLLEINDQGERTEVLSLPGENLAKIIAFEARDGQEYLLMAGQASGQIIRFDPRTKATQTVSSGLDAPTTITFDSSGDLLVAVSTGIVTLDRDQLESDLAPAVQMAKLQPTQPTGGPSRRVEVNLAGIEGMQVDACTGLIYLSLQAEGRVVALDPSDNSITEIAAGLGGPGHLLGTYRLGVSCDDSFNLIIIEKTADQLSLAIPSQGTLISPWVPADDPVDLTMLPPSPLTAETSVFFNQLTAGGGAATNQLPAGADAGTNELVGVQVGDLYQAEAPNPPVMIAASEAASGPGPDLVVGTTSGGPGSAVDTTLFFRPGEDDGQEGGPDEGNVLLLTLDYDQSRLNFDASDGVTSLLAGDFLVFVLHDSSRSDGELGFLVVDAEAPFTPIPRQDLFKLDFTIQGNATGTAFLLLSTPGPQLVDMLSALQALDDVVGGAVSIVP